MLKWINWLLTPSRQPEFENINYEARGGQCTTPLPTAVRPAPPPCPPSKPAWMVAPDPYFVVCMGDDGKMGVERIATFTTRLMRSRFASDDDGNPIHFTSRELARTYLNETFRPEVIRTADYTGPIS